MHSIREEDRRRLWRVGAVAADCGGDGCGSGGPGWFGSGL